jgi:hypothetical protein
MWDHSLTPALDLPSERRAIKYLNPPDHAHSTYTILQSYLTTKWSKEGERNPGKSLGWFISEQNWGNIFVKHGVSHESTRPLACIVNMPGAGSACVAL